jgi:ribose transport system ATP-binding protein
LILENYSLEIKNVSKSFPGVKALDDVSINFNPGEVHALLGENGAGKSTLCKILSGAHTMDSGEILVHGLKFKGVDPVSAKKEGIGIVYQELMLVPQLTVYENIFLGKEIKNGPNIDRKAMIKASHDIFERMKIKLDPTLLVNDLSVAYRQLVEISKAVAEEAKILILDEPTAPLMNKEVELLFKLIQEIKKQGVTIIYISHRIEELFEISDRVTIMRDGKTIKTVETKNTNRKELVSLEVGRELGEDYPLKSGGTIGEVMLEVKSLSTSKLRDISFRLHRGEILGFAGLVGAGRTEIARAVFGADKIDAGEIFVNGAKIKLKKPTDAIAKGLSLIPEDRKGQGVLLKMTVKENISLVVLRKISKALSVNRKRDKEIADDYIDKLSIKTPTIDQVANNLSGGNQQKVALAKWLANDSDILIFDEPTRGIDVKAKQEIYTLMDDLRKQGKAIMMISSEMPELIGMSNRIITMYEGRITGELTEEEMMTQDRILDMASGGAGEERDGQ